MNDFVVNVVISVLIVGLFGAIVRADGGDEVAFYTFALGTTVVGFILVGLVITRLGSVPEGVEIGDPILLFVFVVVLLIGLVWGLFVSTPRACKEWLDDFCPNNSTTPTVVNTRTPSPTFATLPSFTATSSPVSTQPPTLPSVVKVSLGLRYHQPTLWVLYADNMLGCIDVRDLVSKTQLSLGCQGTVPAVSPSLQGVPLQVISGQTDDDDGMVAVITTEDIVFIHDGSKSMAKMPPNLRFAEAAIWKGHVFVGTEFDLRLPIEDTFIWPIEKEKEFGVTAIALSADKLCLGVTVYHPATQHYLYMSDDGTNWERRDFGLKDGLDAPVRGIRCGSSKEEPIIVLENLQVVGRRSVAAPGSVAKARRVFSSREENIFFALAESQGKLNFYRGDLARKEWVVSMPPSCQSIADVAVGDAEGRTVVAMTCKEGLFVASEPDYNWMPKLIQR